LGHSDVIDVDVKQKQRSRRCESVVCTDGVEDPDDDVGGQEEELVVLDSVLLEHDERVQLGIHATHAQGFVVLGVGRVPAALAAVHLSAGVPTLHNVSPQEHAFWQRCDFVVVLVHSAPAHD
jgi:hypothetical protein